MSIHRPSPLTPAPSASQASITLEPDAGSFQTMLQHVPCMDLPCDGDFAQANGVDLPIVAINLAHRPDRLQALSQRLAAVGLTKLIRAPAVEGARLPAEQVAALLRSPEDATDEGPRSHLTLTPPAVGCFLSHLGIWRWMLRTGLPRLLVVEDDADPVAPFSAERLRNVLARMPRETKLAFLGCSIMGGLADKPHGADLARLYYFNGTHAYLITPAACAFLLRHLLPIYAHIDHQTSNVLMQQRHVFPAYYATPLFFDPDWSLGSDCYVPLSDDSAADRELGQIITTSRQTLLAEGRPLLPEFPE
jgi:glycosyl transferase, family 25